MKEKKWFYRTILYIAVCLVMFVLVIAAADPYFHFHAPIRGTAYRLSEERYINDGIARHFEYNAIITGTSMTQNFKTSEFDKLFDCTAVKLPFAGGGYQEISQSLQRAFTYNEHIEKVLWGLDGILLIEESDFQNYEEYPSYLYDNNIFNDVYYVMNKAVMYHGVLNNIAMTVSGEESTTFDEYSAWEGETGYDVVAAYNYWKGEPEAEDSGLSDEEKELVESNIRINICPVIEEHPYTTFYIFFTPYSIVRWDGWRSEGKISAYIEAENIAAQLLMQYTNVELYCFYENTDMICNLDNYRDWVHYTAEINSEILEWISTGEYRLTTDNHKEHVKKKTEFYLNYEYR